MNQAVNQPQNQNQGPTIGTNLEEPWTQPADVGVITTGGAETRDDSPILQIRLATCKKVQFDVDIKKENLFDTRKILSRNTCKIPIYEMEPTFCLTYG